jgi:hypothetical protein
MKKMIFKTTIILIISGICISVSGQGEKKDFRKLQGISDYATITENSSGSPVHILMNPVTNREYITYLCWLADVYRDYPEVFVQAIPGSGDSNEGNSVNNTIDVLKDFTALVFNGREINRNYILNLKYIDYPVIGLTWSQSMNFCCWLSDRYNEFNLIWKKILAFDPNQLNESSFNTEAYIFGQYMGVVDKPFIDPVTKKERVVQWSDRILYPAFRLPSQSELEAAKSSMHKEIVSYKPEKFLDFWIGHYIVIKSDTLFLRLNFNADKPLKIGPSLVADIKSFTSEYGEHSLDEMLPGKSAGIMDIYKSLDQGLFNMTTVSKAEKDKLGHMPFIVIGENSDRNPVFIKRITYNDPLEKLSGLKEKYQIFRVAVNAVK